MTKIQLKRSSVLLSGSAQAPGTSQLDYGEIAVNYNASDPQLFFKNSSGSVVSFFEPYAPLSGASFTGDVSFASDVDLSGDVTIHGDATNGSGKLSLTCESDTHTVHLKAPAHSAAANYTLTLPDNTGSASQVLVTDGSGNLSWALSSMNTADKNKLDGIEAGATTDQTAAEILALLLTVDGSTSGLDADLLDGIHASSFLRNDIYNSYGFKANQATWSDVIVEGQLNSTTRSLLRANGDLHLGGNIAGGSGNIKLYTSGSASFSGNVSLLANLDMQDGDKILLGDNDDFELFHDGSNPY